MAAFDVMQVALPTMAYCHSQLREISDNLMKLENRSTTVHSRKSHEKRTSSFDVVAMSLHLVIFYEFIMTRSIAMRLTARIHRRMHAFHIDFCERGIANRNECDMKYSLHTIFSSISVPESKTKPIRTDPMPNANSPMAMALHCGRIRARQVTMPAKIEPPNTTRRPSAKTPNEIARPLLGNATRYHHHQAQ
jgi:hypothetical protein